MQQTIYMKQSQRLKETAVYTFLCVKMCSFGWNNNKRSSCMSGETQKEEKHRTTMLHLHCIVLNKEQRAWTLNEREFLFGNWTSFSHYISLSFSIISFQFIQMDFHLEKHIIKQYRNYNQAVFHRNYSSDALNCPSSCMLSFNEYRFQTYCFSNSTKKRENEWEGRRIGRPEPYLWVQWKKASIHPTFKHKKCMNLLNYVL